MMQALGLAVSGTEVRLAHLVIEKGQLRIENLERARLKATLEHQPSGHEKPIEPQPEAKDAFGLKESGGERVSGEEASKQDGANLEILYRLLEKYAKKKIKIAFNIPLSMVTYQRQDSPFAAALQGSSDRSGAVDKENGLDLGHELIKSQDGSAITMIYERNAPTMSLLREVNGFLHNNLQLAHMETTEVALANLARSSLKLDSDKITTIIYIEDDFTRLIFLRGGDLFHVSSVIHENADSPNILEVIYRRLLYEQDEAQIPEITTVLLAGKSNRIKAKDFFTAHLHDTTVSYLSSEMLSNFHSNEAQRATFSEFAVPIALAWKLLNPRHQAFIPVNLLPQDFIDQQKVLKLSYHGYLLLAVTGLVAFFFTWQILKMRSQINTARSQNSQLELKIRTNQTTVDRVLELEEQCKRLRKNLALSDSLSKGHDELLAFLQKLNASVEKAGSLWVDEIAKHKDGFAVKGTSLSREKIPIFAEALEQASLRKVTRDEGGSRKLFRFDMERRIASGSFQFSDNGVRIIDVNKFMNDRSLILTKEGPQPNSMAAEAMKSAPEKSTTEQWNSSERQSQKSVRSTTDSESTTRRNVRSTGIVKEAALTRPVTDEPRLAENHESAPATREQEDKPRSDHPKSQPGFAAVTADGITERIENQIVPVTASTNVTAQPAFQRVNGITEAGKPNPMNDEVAEQPKTQPVVTSPQVESSEIYRGYSIQAASSSTRDLAQQYAAAYRKQGYDTAVEKYFDTSKGMYRYRVLVGIFASRAAAEKKAEQMTGLLMPDYRIIGLK